VKISIVTVCFDAERTIGETIRSVADQDWPNLEHIIVDGGSTDRTAEIVAANRHDRLRFHSGPDKGIYDAMNKGIGLATGAYVGFLNADDFLASPHSIREVAEAASRSGADCVLGDTVFVSEDGKRKGRLYSTRGFRRWWLRIGVMPPHPSFYVKTELLRTAGGFDTRYSIAADFDLAARLMLKHQATWCRVPAIITCFRVGGLSTSMQAKRTITAENAASLAALGQPAAGAAVRLRYPIKVLQILAGMITRR
jgi:glycosyltransferase involved in cell wall biosynthesis